MKVDVLFFASLRDAVGASEISLELPEPAGQREYRHQNEAGR